MKRHTQVHSPEHVLIDLVPAGLGVRSAAFLLDAVLIGGLVYLAGTAAGLAPEGMRALLSTTATFVILWGYNTFFEVRWSGQTPGKKIMRVRVVDARGLPVDVAQSLIRNVVRIVDILPLGGIGLAAAALDGEHRRLGDRVADTLVVAESQPQIPAPESLAPRRVNSLQTGAVRRYVQNRIGVHEREFLFSLCLRAGSLSEEARYDLFEEAGAYYRERLGIDDPHLSGEAIVRGIASLCASTALGAV